MKEFKPMKELIKALYEIAKAIKGEENNNNNENKNNGLFGADVIIYPVRVGTVPEQETEEPIYDYEIFYTFDEFFDYFKTQAPYDNITSIIFGYKSDNINIVDKPYNGYLEGNGISMGFVLENASNNFQILHLGDRTDKLNGLYAIFETD